MKSSTMVVTSYGISTSIILANMVAQILDDQINRSPHRFANTIVPLLVIAWYVNTITHLILLEKASGNNLIKRVRCGLLFGGLALIVGGIGVGGGVFKFKRCRDVFIGVATLWSLELIAASAFYHSKVKRL